MDAQSAYAPAQYWVNADNALAPYEQVSVLDENGETKIVPTNDGVEFKMLAGNFMEDILAMTAERIGKDTGRVYKVVLSGASTTVGALRYRSLLASKKTETFGVITYDPNSRSFKSMTYYETSEVTRKLMDGDNKAWKSDPVQGRKNLMHGRFLPSFTRGNKLLDDFPYLITEVYHRPGETVQDVEDRMAQAWFDNLRRKSDLPFMPHVAPDEPHPWAVPLFNYFSVTGDLKWLTSIGPTVTKFHVKDDLKDVIERSIAKGSLPDIRDDIEFLDPRDLEDFAEDDMEPACR